MIVGSTTTGNLRPEAASHDASADTVIVSPVTVCDTFELVAPEASYMYGAGMRSSVTPAAVCNAIDPSRCATAVRPLVSSENEYDTGPDGARLRTMLSFSSVELTWYDTSAPPASPEYVTVEPETFGATPLTAPVSPSSTDRPSFSNRTRESDRSPNKLVNVLVVLPCTKPPRVVGRTFVSIGCHRPRPSR